MPGTDLSSQIIEHLLPQNRDTLRVCIALGCRNRPLTTCAQSSSPAPRILETLHSCLETTLGSSQTEQAHIVQTATAAACATLAQAIPVECMPRKFVCRRSADSLNKQNGTLAPIKPNTYTSHPMKACATSQHGLLHKSTRYASATPPTCPSRGRSTYRTQCITAKITPLVLYAASERRCVPTAGEAALKLQSRFFFKNCQNSARPLLRFTA